MSKLQEILHHLGRDERIYINEKIKGLKHENKVLKRALELMESCSIFDKQTKRNFVECISEDQFFIHSPKYYFIQQAEKEVDNDKL